MIARDEIFDSKYRRKLTRFYAKSVFLEQLINLYDVRSLVMQKVIPFIHSAKPFGAINLGSTSINYSFPQFFLACFLPKSLFKALFV